MEGQLKSGLNLFSKKHLHWWSYGGLLLLVFLYNWSEIWLISSAVIVYLVAIPVLSGTPLKFRLDRVEVCQAFTISLLVLGIVGFLFLIFGASFKIPQLKVFVFHILLASIPEEIYFRGFLQEKLGNTPKAVVFVSFLFSFAHMPRLFFTGDLTSILTFFPSLFMGFLYYKTGNLLHPIVFHSLSNLLIESTQGVYPL